MTTNNDALLKEQGLPVLTKYQKKSLRKKWQDITINDMRTSLKQYGKYVMLRPTGFGKTFICALIANEYAKKGKVIFVYKSDILKHTFELYTKGKNAIIKNPENIIYETYASVGLYWGDKNYLDNTLDIKNVSFIIFDECQFMGAETYRKALDFALTYVGHTVYTDDDEVIENSTTLGKFIPYIGATATIERRDVDVCDKYFTYSGHEGLTYCWGENVFTLEDAFKTGLIIPPYYQYISATDELGNNIISKNRLTRNRLLKNLNIKSKDGDELTIKSMKELQKMRILDADKIIHDTMLYLYRCDNPIKEEESLPPAMFNTVSRPENLPSYMRFLVFTHDRDSMDQMRGDEKEEFLGIVDETKKYYENAFGRYGYTIRTTIVSSVCFNEKKNVELIDPTEEELKKINATLVNEDGLSRAVTHMNNGKPVIDLVFSINMLNVGYHVDHITGIVLRRWTGSNTIYYQQLGRCLSIDSNRIPVVFDFVDSIASAEITAPLFAVDKDKKAVTTYADGTEDISYKGKKNHNKRINDIKIVDGKPFNPKWINVERTKSIIIDSAVADCSDILSRLNIYENQVKAYSIFDEAYKEYADSYKKDDSGKLNPNTMRPLYDCLRHIIMTKYPAKVKGKGLLTLNANALYNYIMKKEYNVFIEYRAFKMYYEKKEEGIAVQKISDEYNSLLRSSKSDMDRIGAKLNFVVSRKDYKNFVKDDIVKDIIKKYNMVEKNIMVY